MFEKAIARIKENALGVHGIEFTADGRTVFSHMFDDDIRYPVYSCTKAVTAFAVGIAADEGRFDISRPLSSYLPEKYLLAMDEDKRRAFSALPVRRFMTMSVKGYPFRAEGGDLLSASLAYDIDYSAPPAYDYSNIPAYLAGVACEYALGEPLTGFIQRRLFDPLGIENVTFQTDAQGRYYGASGIYLTVHELGRLGGLILDGGCGIVPPWWISEMIRTHIEIREGGYGLFVFTKPDRVYISGKWGQRSVILPDRKAVLTYMSDAEDTSSEVHAAAEEMIKELRDEV